MPTAAPGDPLGRALEEAVAGRPRALHDLLARGSRLPGARMNDALADAFAQACRTAGARADAVALAMARLDADAAPGATSLEFLPVCGLYALAARAAAEARFRPRAVAELHARADDLRFRVRDAVVVALARIGAACGDALVGEVAPWMDGYFHAAAVVRALARDEWLAALRDAAGVVARLDEAFTLALDAPRAAARYPGHKALTEALARAPGDIAARLGVPVFDMLERAAPRADPPLREAIAAAVASKKLPGRYSSEVARVRRALDASLPPPRNPDHDFGPTRRRGGKRRR